MEAVFLNIVNMSAAASWMILAVIIIRFIMKKAKIPKGISCILWALVAIRLICPFSLESMFSLIPSAEIITQETLLSQEPVLHTGVDIINQTVNPILQESMTPDPATSANPLQIWTFIATCVWVIGMALLLGYACISYIRLHKRVKASVKLQENVWISDAIETPFILGIIRPKIFLPSRMEEKWMESVLHHERIHLKRRDHWWKPMGYLLLTVYWFNPLIWIAYCLLCRDIEMACDESVVRDMDSQEKKEYSKALLSCSISRKMIAACPLAFGEVGVKERIKSVLHYKRPTFWILIISILICVVLGVCFLTNPKEQDTYDSDIELAEVEEEIPAPEDSMIPYEQNEDGTWTAEGYVYQYRLILKGRLPNAVKDSTYVVLTNNPDVTFEEVAMSLFSSSLEVGFSIEETRLVDLGVSVDTVSYTEEFHTLKEVMKILSAYSDEIEELKNQGCYVVVHGDSYSGEEYWSSFYDNVGKGVPADLVLVQFTTEGDPVLDYIQYNGESFYQVHDSSRDAFSGDQEPYTESTYPYIKAFEPIMENGDICRYVYSTTNESLTLEDVFYVYENNSRIENADFEHILYAVLGNTNTGVCEVLDYENEPTPYEEIEIPIEEISKIEVLNGNTGNIITLKPDTEEFKNVTDAYYELEYTLAENPDDENWRMGYLYRISIYDQNDEAVQIITPYMDSIQMNGDIYDSSMNRTAADLIIQLDELF